jgi:hypothetical protein
LRRVTTPSFISRQNLITVTMTCMAVLRESKMKCRLSLMDSSGDKEATWDSDSPDEVAAAKAIFEAVKKRGYLVYSQPAGESGVALAQFDANVETMIAVPPIVAG